MQDKDITGFFADSCALDLEDYLLLDYYFECQGDPRLAAAHFCSEQSTAQWQRIGVDEDFRPRFAAKVIELQVLGQQDHLSYALHTPLAGPFHACRVKIAHPHANFGPKLPNLLSAVCGEGVFFAPGIPVVKLLDIQFPETYLAAFEGPKFGIHGLRERLDVYDRPIFFGVIKPNIGLSPEPFAQAGYAGWLGGLDIAKDDEMLADVSWSTLEERSRLLGQARREAEAKTGRRKIYLANITDEVDRLLELHDIAVANGANALMVNAMTTGLSAVRWLRKHTRVPLVGHFPMIAAFSRLPHYGIHAQVMTTLQRLAGLDVIIMPGFGQRMMTPETEVLDCVKACTRALGSIKPSLPVPGGSDWAGTLGDVYAKVGSIDFGFVPGRGVFSHPLGPTGGAASICQAWEAIVQGIPLAEYAQTRLELRRAIEAFA